MIKVIVVFLTMMVIIALIWLVPVLTQLRRQRLKNQPMSLHWLTIIQQNLPIYQHLPEPLQKRLQGHVNVILAEKQFVGCGGLSITSEIKLTIAAIASLLLLNERGEYYPKLCSILVYPSAYVVNQTKPISNYVVQESKVVRLGESWTRDRLSQTARIIVGEYQGKIPEEETELLKLPGIGKYTARAICSQAFGRGAAVLDTNVARILERFFGIEGGRVKSRCKILWNAAETVAPDTEVGYWNLTLLDFGAIVCTARNPKCSRCPLSERCCWFELNKTKSFI